MKHGGLALILVVGVLGILAVLAAAFVTMAQLERRASAQRLYATKAELMARSGIEDALARLGAGQDPEAASNSYQGEDWDWTPAGVPTLSSREAASEVYLRTGTGSTPDTVSCPVVHAMRPSFWAARAGAPDLLTLDGRERGYTGQLPSERGLYALRLDAGFHVNGGDPSQPAADGYNAVLRRMLGNLAEALDRSAGSNDGKPVDLTDGERLVTLRPGGGWVSYAQIRDLALGGSQAKLEALTPYLALDAWVDRKVIAPNARESQAGGNPQAWGNITRDRGGAPGFERAGTRVVGRAPVDFSWACRSRPALTALVAGLKGLYLDENAAQYIGGGDTVGTLKTAEIRNLWSPTDDTQRAVLAIMANADLVKTWQDWNALCDALPLTGSGDEPQAKRDILKANFNPNSDLNKLNPDLLLWKMVDKSDLLAYSTEFSLHPLQPRRVTSAGRILDAGGRVLGFRQLSACVGGASAVRLTTQKEFVSEDLGDLDLAGDEQVPRLPGDPRFLSQSRGTGPTWGHRIHNPNPGTWLNGNSLGTGLQPYPEAYHDDGGGLDITPADYDGWLQLATLETRDDDFYTVDQMIPSPPPVTKMMLLARFDDGFDLDLWDSTATSGQFCRSDLALVSTTELDLSLLDPVKPGTLHPDGAYSELGRTPSYLSRGNAHGYHGVLSFWVKPGYRLNGPRGHPLVAATNVDEFALYDFGGAEPTAVSDIYLPAPDASLASPQRLATDRHQLGRYCRGWDYAEAWNPVHPNDEAPAYLTAPITLPPGALLKRIAWTCLRPSELPEDFIELELVNDQADAFLAGASLSRSSLSQGWTRDRQSWSLLQPASLPFRVRVVFRRPSALPESTPLLVSPVLDDLTLIYSPKGGPRILRWGGTP